MRITGSDGLAIEFETVGRGHPLVLLHGFFGDRTTWHSAGYVDTLTDHFRLVLIDARGHGESEAPHDSDGYAISRQVDDVLAVLDALEIEQAAVWGASMGGIIGFHLLASHPERLTTLVAGGSHAVPITIGTAEAEAEAAVFRTQGTAPFIETLERQGPLPLPTWMRTVIQAADPNALAAWTIALDNRRQRPGRAGFLRRCAAPARMRSRPPTSRDAGDRRPDTRRQMRRDQASAGRGTSR
ncbi:alpha/beta fold hydrolase [Streptomyces sp. NPDC096136]|uniref:alpha/beta fold hydrolase n=1 Tax=Streptomyces sp. NPDC096136 TaxID=3366076 RepID=UPI00381F9C0D